MKMSKLSFTLKFGKDLIFDYYSGEGGGGQKRNKTKNCVRLSHPASKVTVRAPESRSRKQNERKALERLKDHPIFKAWLRMECSARLQGYQNIEAKIDKMMSPSNLRIEMISDNK